MAFLRKGHLMSKPILCLDFDGVLHSYTSGWKGADVIPDPPVPGALKFIAEAMEYFTVAIFSSRSNQPGGIQAMQEWLDYWAQISGTPPTPVGEVIQWPTEKPAAFLTIDDRALTFTGTWPDVVDLLKFKPWNK
jgi:hypothetical protein